MGGWVTGDLAHINGPVGVLLPPDSARSVLTARSAGIQCKPPVGWWPVQVLLLDEITVDLDVVGRLDLLHFFKQECEGEANFFLPYCLRCCRGVSQNGKPHTLCGQGGQHTLFSLPRGRVSQPVSCSPDPVDAAAERGATIIYATHIFDGLEQWPTHLAYVENGRMLRGGSRRRNRSRTAIPWQPSQGLKADGCDL